MDAFLFFSFRFLFSNFISAFLCFVFRHFFTQPLQTILIFVWRFRNYSKKDIINATDSAMFWIGDNLNFASPPPLPEVGVRAHVKSMKTNSDFQRRHTPWNWKTGTSKSSPADPSRHNPISLIMVQMRYIFLIPSVQTFTFRYAMDTLRCCKIWHAYLAETISI